MKKAIAFILIVGVLGVLCLFLFWQSADYRTQISVLEKNIDELQERLDALRSANTDADTGGTQSSLADEAFEKERVEDTINGYLDALYHSKSDTKYGQVIYVADYLTDNGIYDFLEDSAWASAYGDDNIEEIRREAENAQPIDHRFAFSANIYTKMDAALTSCRALIWYTGSYEEGISESVSLSEGVFEFKLIKDENDTWLIDETVKKMIF